MNKWPANLLKLKRKLIFRRNQQQQDVPKKSCYDILLPDTSIHGHYCRQTTKRIDSSWWMGTINVTPTASLEVQCVLCWNIFDVIRVLFWESFHTKGLCHMLLLFSSSSSSLSKLHREMIDESRQTSDTRRHAKRRKSMWHTLLRLQSKTISYLCVLIQLVLQQRSTTNVFCYFYSNVSIADNSCLFCLHNCTRRKTEKRTCFRKENIEFIRQIGETLRGKKKSRCLSLSPVG
jgi:hypothetical protein